MTPKPPRAGKKVAIKKAKSKSADMPRQAKEGTVAWLADITAKEDLPFALNVVRMYREDPGSYKLIKAAEGVPVLRTDVSANASAESSDRIHYLDFSPPALWNPSYSVLRVRFDDGEVADHYMHHGGEELLVPVQGAIDYSFLLKRKGGLRRELVSTHLPDGNEHPRKTPLQPGEILRCQCSVPHHTWASTGTAEAWMCIRHLSENLAAIRSRSQSGAGIEPRKVPAKDFESNPEQYAMCAWGLAEMIRLRRVAADLQIHELADRCGLERAQLSRIESGQANVSLQKLVQLGEELGFDILEPLTRPLWGWERDGLFRKRERSGKNDAAVYSETLVTEQNHGGCIFPRSLWLPAGSPWSPPKAREQPSGVMVSWIVLEGGVFFTFEGSQGDHYAHAGDVLHLRDCRIQSIHARHASKLMEFTCRSLARI